MGLQAQQDVGHSPYNLRTLILGHYRLHLPFSVEGPSSLCINQKETADFRAQTVGRDRAESLYVGGLFSEQEARHQQQSHLQRPVPSSVQLKDGRCLGCLPPHPISAQAKGVHTHARAHTQSIRHTPATTQAAWLPMPVSFQSLLCRDGHCPQPRGRARKEELTPTSRGLIYRSSFQFCSLMTHRSSLSQPDKESSH